MSTADYRRLFLEDRPLLDVRAPAEFAKGGFPTSVNIPLLDDEQRTAIGTEYRKLGQEAAIQLGWRLVTPPIKAQRQRDWLAFVREHPQGYLHCARGGLRSQLAQQLIREAGADYPRVDGGYKAMRQFLLDALERLGRSTPLILLSGRTCSGKTHVLNELPNTIDLEGLARHRGSAFGRQMEPQPPQAGFENALAVALLKHSVRATGPLVLEDEGKLIGCLYLPPDLREAMQRSDLVVIDADIEERLDVALQDYVRDAVPRYTALYGDEEGHACFRRHWLDNLARIRKRLGGERWQRLHDLFDTACTEYRDHGSTNAFRAGIEILLTEYYDPMYDYQRGLRGGRVLFQGGRQAVVQWLHEHIADDLRTAAQTM